MFTHTYFLREEVGIIRDDGFRLCTDITPVFSTLIAGKRVNMLIDWHAMTQDAIRSLLLLIKSRP